MPLWALLEQTEKTDFGKCNKMIIAVNYLVFIVRLYFLSYAPAGVLLLHSAFISAIIFSDPVASKRDQHLTLTVMR